MIGFQENMEKVELDGRNVLQLHTVVPMLAAYDFVHLDNDNPIAFKKSRFTLLESGATRIASADGGKTILRDRWLTHAILSERASGRQFIVFNTHLSATSEGSKAAAAREPQARRIASVIRSVSRNVAIPFVLTGDLNVPEGGTGKVGRPLTHLTGAGMVNSSEWAVRNTGNPKAVSLQSMTAIVNGKRTYKAVRTSGRTLDYVWAPRGALIKTYRVSTGPHTLRRTVGGVRYWFYAADRVLPSDHNPVVAEVAFSDSIAKLGATAARAGSHQLAGKIYETYLKKGGWEAFGLPTTNRWRTAHKGIAVWTQRFANGTIQWSSRAVRASVNPATTSLSGTRGFRDALAAASLKPGVIYRSGDLRKSTKTGRALLSGLLHKGRIIDLRTKPESSRRPDPKLSKVARSGYSVGAAASPERFVTNAGSRAAFKKALARVATTSGPILVHCSDNRVRTGWAVALIMYAGGASDADVQAEYRRTSGAAAAGITAAIRKAKSRYGSMQGYLTEGLGLSANQIASIKAKVSNSGG